MDRKLETLDGWRVLHGCVLPGPLPCKLALVALHPQRGIVLVDGLPEATPEAESRLLMRLRLGGFEAIYGDRLPPVIHLALTPQEVADPGPALAAAFRGSPMFALPGGDAWVDTTIRSLVPGLPLSSGPRPSAGRMRLRTVPRRRTWWRLFILLSLLDAGLAGFCWLRLTPPGQVAAGPHHSAAPSPKADASDVMARQQGRAVGAAVAAFDANPHQAGQRCRDLVQRIETGEPVAAGSVRRFLACRLGG